jgi:hypothetical protein
MIGSSDTAAQYAEWPNASGTSRRGDSPQARPAHTSATAGGRHSAHASAAIAHMPMRIASRGAASGTMRPGRTRSNTSSAMSGRYCGRMSAKLALAATPAITNGFQNVRSCCSSQRWREYSANGR